jgi:hypothetical protein
VRRRANPNLFRKAAGVIVLAILLGGPLSWALADDTVAVSIRSGNHPGFGRVVFDAPPRLSYQVTHDGDRVTVRFADDVALTGDPKLPRNVAALQADHAQAVLTVAAGTTFHASRLGDHVVIDVFDPVTAGTGDRAGGAPASTASSPSPPAASAPAESNPRPDAHPARQVLDAAAPAALPLPPDLPPPLESAPLQPPAANVTSSPGVGVSPDVTASQEATAASEPAAPVVLAAALTTLPPDTKGAAFTLPFSGNVGAAVFRRHGETLVVFDERRPIDLSALQSAPELAGARVEMVPSGTLIRITPPPGTEVSLSKTGQSWTVAVLAVPPPLQPLVAEPDNASLTVAAREPAGVLTIADPATGGILLVGTQLQPGQAITTVRRTAQFTLLPTMQGVVVAPLADTVALRAVPDGFALTTTPDPLAVSRDDVESFADADALTRRFNFPSLAAATLMRQLSTETADAAALPILARGPKRREAALTMIGLGMDAEAQALLLLTAADDPRQAASADVIGLTAIAAMLAGRPAEAAGIDDPRLTGTDEIALWRALRIAMLDDTSPSAAVALAGTAPLLLSYPPQVRDKVLPLAVETMIKGGADSAATALLLRSQGLPGLGLARAMLAQATGDTNAALAQYDTLAVSDDRFVRARAAVRAVELRAVTGKFDTRQTAEALDRLLYSWRGDQRELALREKVAGLRQQLGEWRQALALLRDSETLFPDDANEIHARLQETFDALLHDGAADKMPALEFVSLVDENADLVPNTREGEAMQAMLADKLLALDLPKRAGPVLDKLMRAMPPGPGRAAFGTRLAKLRLGDSDPDGALAALAASDTDGLPAPVTEQRTLLRGEAQARLGDVNGAIATLAGLDSVAADAARAGILEQARDWAGADRALAAYVVKAVPQTGTLDDGARRLLLRLATAAARAGDATTLAALREQQVGRMGSGPLADMFRLLTADPVSGTGDLTRVGREVGYARALPADLQAMRP